ncbi:MAG: hypothetical protein IT515_15275 [Burkholderiales bacterium]|nr:hypothetical protein [Burkholderiales bacterium]
MRTRRWLILALVLALVGFLGWRFVRPLNIFTVSPAFERPIDTSAVPASVGSLRAEDCGRCHGAMYAEWQTSMHGRAWTDAYFQTDWRFDGSQQICKNCHIPLDRQQESRVLGFRDRDKWDPVLAPNPDFDPALQHEGVTCAACHLHEGKILGPYGDARAEHPVAKLTDPNEICLRCHVVQGERWDTFYQIPPCGTAAEIAAGAGSEPGRSGEYLVKNVAALGCVECHMPAVERPLVPDGTPRLARRHLWRGGNDPETVTRALDVRVAEQAAGSAHARAFALTLTNIGARHFLPTGTPDRHLTVEWRLLDAQGRLLDSRDETLERKVMWRPFIVDLWDTRLRFGEPRTLRFEFRTDREPRPAALAVAVRYHLLHESRRKRIGYANATPIAYPVFEETIALDATAQTGSR